MKKYIPENMVKISRYQNFFPTPPEDIRSDIYARMEELIREEEAYCDQGNRRYVRAVITATSDLFATVQMPETGGRGQKAYDMDV